MMACKPHRFTVSAISAVMLWAAPQAAFALPMPPQAQTAKKSTAVETPENQKLFSAIETGSTLQIRQALDSGANPNFRSKKALYAPVLFRAMANGSAPAVALLIAAGAQVESTDHRGTPILVAAASLAHSGAQKIIDAIEVLIVRGRANPNAQDTAYVGDDRTALQAAASGGSLRLVKLLLAAGADPNRLNRHNESALHFAAEKGHTAIVQELLKWGALPDLKSRHTAMTPLMVAAENGNLDVIQVLVQENVRRDAKNAFGKTPLDLARAKMNPNKGRTPAAVRAKFLRTVRFLEKLSFEKASKPALQKARVAT
ncbi:MAG: ankyrin repeat domain-containing protein [Bdellovibrionales bacterium]|nr:ankyrin repeat domain-containing protein [Bdellovibrionales bacterium]